MASLYALHSKVTFPPTKTVAFDMGRTTGLARTLSMREKKNKCGEFIIKGRSTNRAPKVICTSDLPCSLKT